MKTYPMEMDLLKNEFFLERATDNVGLVVAIREGYHGTRAGIYDLSTSAHFVPVSDILKRASVILKFSIT
jgi:hypothetical protein